jgi:hypothetical protein
MNVPLLIKVSYAYAYRIANPRMSQYGLLRMAAVLGKAEEPN